MIYNARKPPVTTTFPVVQAIKIDKTLETLADLQALGISSFSLDIGPVGDSATMTVRIKTPSELVVAYKNNVLVKVKEDQFQVFPDETAFLAVYTVIT